MSAPCQQLGIVCGAAGPALPACGTAGTFQCLCMDLAPPFSNTSFRMICCQPCGRPAGPTSSVMPLLGIPPDRAASSRCRNGSASRSGRRSCQHAEQLAAQQPAASRCRCLRWHAHDRLSLQLAVLKAGTVEALTWRKTAWASLWDRSSSSESSKMDSCSTALQVPLPLLCSCSATAGASPAVCTGRPACKS